MKKKGGILKNNISFVKQKESGWEAKACPFGAEQVDWFMVGGGGHHFFIPLPHDLQTWGEINHENPAKYPPKVKKFRRLRRALPHR